MSKSLRTCRSCGWVHFAVTREYAERSLKEFNDYFYSFPLEAISRAKAARVMGISLSEFATRYPAPEEK